MSGAPMPAGTSVAVGNRGSGVGLATARARTLRSIRVWCVALVATLALVGMSGVPALAYDDSVEVAADTFDINGSNSWMSMNLSAYCIHGSMSDGAYTHDGAVAAGSNLSFGTLVEIQGLGTYRVEDRGGAITSNRLDVWMPSCSSAIQFGRYWGRVRILRHGWFGQ